MKVSMYKNPGGLFSPSDEIDEEQLRALKNFRHYKVSITLDQNYELHKKIFAFFKYCTQFYYGDRNVTKEQIDLTRGKLTIGAGYVTQTFLPDGIAFELTPKSISYAKMPPEERTVFYSNLIDSALKNVFHTADEDEYEKLMSFFPK